MSFTSSRHRPARAMRVVAILALLASMALAARPTAQAQDAALEAQLDRIARETAAARELAPLAEIDDVILTRDELMAMLPALIAEDFDPGEAEAESRSLAALGLLPAGIDMVELSLRLLGEQAAGFYDPRSDEMMVVTDGDDFGAEAFYYAHEVVHALQDAHLDPDDLMEEPLSGNDDRELAAVALYEGDAMAAATAYLERNPGLAFKILQDAQGEFPELDEAPALVSILLMFPYSAGHDFVARLRSDGGWAAVDAAYGDIPASTEQILHPLKYLERDTPSSLALPAPGTALGETWSLVDEDTLGELQTAILLAALEPGAGFSNVTGTIDLPEPARNAAAGWDGDRYALWSDGVQDVLLWRSVWDTPEDARAFSRALAQREDERWGGLFNGESPDDIALVTAEIAARIQLDGQEVRYVQAPTLPLADAAMAALATAPAPDPAPGSR